MDTPIGKKVQVDGARAGWTNGLAGLQPINDCRASDFLATSSSMV